MERWVGQVAVVTGASVGIGAAIAQKLVEHGLKVVGLARRADKIVELSKTLAGPGKLHAFQADIGKEADIIAAFKWTEDNVGPVSILINNAGILKQTNLLEGDTDKWRQTLEVNVMGLSIATREGVKSMRKNGINGHVVHINSVVGHKIIPLPDMNMYPASKHAVTALTELLRQELNRAGTKIKITSVSPGGVATEIAKTNNFDEKSELVEMFKEAPLLQPEDVAEAVLYTLATPPHVQVHEILIKAVNEEY